MPVELRCRTSTQSPATHARRFRSATALCGLYTLQSVVYVDSCAVAQVQQVKKVNKFTCAACGVRLECCGIVYGKEKRVFTNQLQPLSSSEPAGTKLDIKMQAKQSVRRVYAVSAKARDVREVVQHLNLCRQQRDCARDAAALEAAAIDWQTEPAGGQQTATQPRSTPCSTGTWDEFLQVRRVVIIALASTRLRPSAHRMEVRPCMLLQKAAVREQPDSGHADKRFVTALPDTPSKKRQTCAHAEAEAAGASPLHALILSL